MSNEPTTASLWRVELAKELIGYYAPHDGIDMAVLSGSPAKGLSDEYSDLDIVIFWNEIDAGWLEDDPLRDLKCERRYFRKAGSEDLYLEFQYFGPLKVDIGHVTTASWAKDVDDVLVRHDTDAEKIGALAGFETSLPLLGLEEVERWKARIGQYPAELAEKIVRMHRRFFVPGYLLNQAYGRGDVLAYYDGLCLMLKNILNILAGLNRVFLSTEEPRWLSYYLGRMTVKPPRAEERFRAVLGGEPDEAVRELEQLMADTMALIAEHMPQINGGFEDRWRSMAVTECREKPTTR
jgi:hypothetical protein